MSKLKPNKKASNLSIKPNDLSSNSSNTKIIQHKKVSSYIFSNYLPIYQSKLIKSISSGSLNNNNINSSKSSNTSLIGNLNRPQLKDEAIQCRLIDYKMNLFFASNLSIAKNAIFPNIYLKRFSKIEPLAIKQDFFFKKLSLNSYNNNNNNHTYNSGSNSKRPSGSEVMQVAVREIGKFWRVPEIWNLSKPETDFFK
jgi:hypothetical protein